MPYGIIKVDTVTFTDNGVDKNISLSGLVQNPTFTGNVTATGTISGNIIRGGTTVSGLTVTGTTANFASGVFTTQVSGLLITGPTVSATTGNFTSLTGTTTTGTTANFASGVFSTQVSGLLITGPTVSATTGNFTSLTGTTTTMTSGVFALGTEPLPSISFASDPNTGIFSPGADQVAISTNGVERVRLSSTGEFMFKGAGTTPGTDKAVSFNGSAPVNSMVLDSSGRLGMGISAPNAKLDIEAANFVGGPAIGARYNTSNVRLGFNIANSNGYVYIGSNTNNKLNVDTPTYDLTGHLASQLRFDAGQLIFNNAPSGTAGNDITFTNRLTITAAGLVGIGTTSPKSILTTQGNIVGLSETTHSLQHYQQASASFTVTSIDSVISGASGSLVFKTGTNWTNGNAIEAARIRSDGMFEVKGAGTAGSSPAFSVNGSAPANSAVIDTSGRLLVGTSTARIAGQDLAPYPANAGDITLERADICGLNIISNRSDQIGAVLRFGKSTGNAVSSNAIVGNNNRLGTIQFCGADGTDMVSVGAQIEALVDDTPGADDMPGRLVFSTTPDGASSPTERMSIKATGDVSIVTGNLIIGTAGKGIDFSADGNAAGMTSELLDDYEEGTFTPTVSGGSTAGVGTYSIQSGKYVKIGGKVFVEVALTWSAHTGTGSMFLTGLPFTSAADETGAGMSVGRVNNLAITALCYLTGYIVNSNTAIALRAIPTGGGAENAVGLDTAAEINCSITYMVV